MDLWSGTSGAAVRIYNSSATLTIGSLSHTLIGDGTEDPGPYIFSRNSYSVYMNTQAQEFYFYSGCIASTNNKFCYGKDVPRPGYHTYSDDLLRYLVPD